MPELPEVETVRRQLDQRLRGARIQSVTVLRSGREFPLGEAFIHGLAGRTIQSIDRRAKLLIWRFEDQQALLGHLKMTGRFVFVDHEYAPQKHDRIVFDFVGARHAVPLRLVWSDIRQFGFLKLVTASELEQVISGYGPEPLEVATEVLAHCLRVPHTRVVKAALMNQAIIAGVGNIYADEALHRAGIRPTRRLATLTAHDRYRLAQAVQTVLRESVAQQGTSANDYVDTRGERGGFLGLLRVYGRFGQACQTCQTPIKKITLMQRGTHYCPRCQV